MARSRKSHATLAIFPGTFDPITLGHLDIIDRARRLFDHLIVAIGVNPEKDHLLPPEERLKLVRDLVRPFKNVSAEAYTGLTVQLVKKRKATAILRGLRNPYLRYVGGRPENLRPSRRDLAPARQTATEAADLVPVRARLGDGPQVDPAGAAAAVLKKGRVQCPNMSNARPRVRSPRSPSPARTQATASPTPWLPPSPPRLTRAARAA